MKKIMLIALAAVLVVAFTAPAMAATKSVTFYGSARYMTYMTDVDKKASKTGYDDKDLTWSLDDGCTRFGASFKAGKIEGLVEIRPRDRQSTRTRGMSVGGSMDFIRHWYGAYDFGPAKLLVGQWWTPDFSPVSREVMLGGGGFMDGYGDAGNTARAPGFQIWVPLKSIDGMLKIGLLEPYKDPGPGDPAIGPTVFDSKEEMDTTLPKFTLGLSANFGALGIWVGGGYNTVKYVDSSDKEESLDSWVAGLNLTYTMGPLYVKAHYDRNKNYSTYGTGGPQVAFGLFPQDFGMGSIQDVTGWGFIGVLGFRFNEMISLEGGWGTREYKQDYLNDEIELNDVSAYYFMLPIQIAKGFTITPEVLITDEGKCKGPGSAPTGVTYGDRGSKKYYGAYWQIDF
ncbi:MAG: porin [Deltaproteobacteria bacterium]|nr:porin [Deltaproteobacteria bacterium]